MELAHFTLGYLCSCILEGCGPEEALPECLSGKRSGANVVTTDASMYLRQQLLSVFPVNALQFHPIASSSVQCAVNELVHTGLPGYSFSFFLCLPAGLDGASSTAAPCSEETRLPEWAPEHSPGLAFLP